MIEPAPSEPIQTSTVQVITHPDGAETREWEMVLPKMVRRRPALDAGPELGPAQPPLNRLLGVMRRWPRIPAIAPTLRRSF